MPGDFLTIEEIEGVQQSSGPFFTKAGIQMISKAIDKTVPKLLILEEFSQQIGTPGRIGLVGPIGIGVKAEAVAAVSLGIM